MQQFFEVEKAGKNEAYDMSAPHSHDYYELYFLIEGKRRLFLQNNMLVLEPKSFCVIPPFCMHKTEGGKYLRVNINISQSLLSKDERAFLDACAKKQAVRLDDTYCDFCYTLLNEASAIQSEWRYGDDSKLALTKTLLHFLRKQTLKPLTVSTSAEGDKAVDTLMLNVAYYVNERYTENIDLKTLCDTFFLSKASLCARFKRTFHCSVIQYQFKLRISKAKDLLVNTSKSMEEVAESCGFSSANYFGLTFKKATGLSPLHYRQNK
jgi:YesN/AraC family two-component response regulator